VGLKAADVDQWLELLGEVIDAAGHLGLLAPRESAFQTAAVGARHPVGVGIGFSCQKGDPLGHGRNSPN